LERSPTVSPAKTISLPHLHSVSYTSQKSCHQDAKTQQPKDSELSPRLSTRFTTVLEKWKRIKQPARKRNCHLQPDTRPRRVRRGARHRRIQGAERAQIGLLCVKAVLRSRTNRGVTRGGQSQAIREVHQPTRMDQRNIVPLTSPSFARNARKPICVGDRKLLDGSKG
jgi:hypothetical protein